ncbi:MAG TPA: hypothetical protein VNS55_14090 [Nocardioides sp.]|nr:hypothetical protein [Nocardioides sp.]
MGRRPAHGRLAVVSLLAASGVLALPVAPAAAEGPWNGAAGCVDTGVAATTLAAPADESWEVRYVAGVDPTKAADFQADLDGHDPSSLLNQGLGANPRGAPGWRVPIILVPGPFDGAQTGITSNTCANTSVDAVVVRADRAVHAMAATGAHELFHVYSSGFAGANLPDNWFEEAAASWFEPTAGYPDHDDNDDALLPRLPLDVPVGGTWPGHPYAMNRFLQLLDDHGLIRGTADWPLIRAVITGYSAPGPTDALEAYLASRRSLGSELGAFWGDRMKAVPAHGPALTKDEAVTTTVEPGVSEKKVSFEVGLQGKFRIFHVQPDVERVEFEYQLPEGVYAWARLTTESVIEVKDGDVVSFCRQAPDPDDYELVSDNFWTILTNGTRNALPDGTKIIVRARKGSEGCTGVDYNKACKVIKKAGLAQRFSPGSWPVYNQDLSGNPDTYRCIRVRHSDANGIDMTLSKWARSTDLKKLREHYREAVDQGGFDPIGVGDVAGINVVQTEDGPVAVVLMLVGRTAVLFTTGGGRSDGVDVARVVAEAI